MPEHKVELQRYHIISVPEIGQVKVPSETFASHTEISKFANAIREHSDFKASHAIEEKLQIPDREANTTARLVKRATAKQAGAEPGFGTKLVTGAGKLVDKTVPPAAAAAGEQLGESQPSGHHALIRTSDGAFHTVPVEHLDTVRQRDPDVTVISEK